MAFDFISRLKQSFNVFRGKPQSEEKQYWNMASSSRPDMVKMHYGNERSIINAIYNRIATDVSMIPIRHVRVDYNDQFLDVMDSDLDYCLKVEPNIDQTPQMLIKDLVLTMLDEGVAVLVPTDTDVNVYTNDSFNIQSLRVGKVRAWFPKEVEVYCYNDTTGTYETIKISKRKVAVIENPFYSVMNEPNSTLRRLIRKLNILDNIDNINDSNKFNLIIQNPYNVKSSLRREEVEKKLEILEDMLSKSKYGIGYMDGAEKITQLGRQLDNGIMSEIDYLTKLLYSQLGMPQSIMDNTADANTQNNYLHRTIEPIINNICRCIKRTFLTRTAISQRQSIMYFVNPFSSLDITNAAELADKFTRNEILSSNEVRQGMGFKPSNDPKADMLLNSNLNHSPEEFQNGMVDNLDYENGGTPYNSQYSNDEYYDTG